MFELVNRTPFVASLIPGLGRDDIAHLTVLTKATFRMASTTGSLDIAEQQMPYLPVDQCNGPDPANSSVRVESDACPAKPGTDVVLVGHAYTGGRPRASVDVGLRVADLRKVVRVTGQRCWADAGLAWVISSPPLAFERMPLVYERAFGGVDRAHPDPARHGAEERNPVGTGFAATSFKARMKGMALPNLEDPRHPIRAWSDRPPIAGFGFVGRGWLPRRSFAGTYDQRWQDQRSPLLPEDFDARYLQGAPLDQIATPHLQGGEPVQLINCSPAGSVAFSLPRIGLSIAVDWDGGKRSEGMPYVLDTVVLEPDDSRVVMCWRSTFRCGRRLRQVRRVVVRMPRRA
jgi:hypothetical protein